MQSEAKAARLQWSFCHGENTATLLCSMFGFNHRNTLWTGGARTKANEQLTTRWSWRQTSSNTFFGQNLKKKQTNSENLLVKKTGVTKHQKVKSGSVWAELPSEQGTETHDAKEMETKTDRETEEEISQQRFLCSQESKRKTGFVPSSVTYIFGLSCLRK